MQKPLIVYVSGSPGSGKTTLAKILSEKLSLPRIGSDVIHSGVAFSNPDHDRKQTLLNVFVPTIQYMSQKNICLIADHVLLKGISENDIIDKLKKYSKIINVHT